MPETPISTETGTHPFDSMELAIIRSLCAQTAQVLAGGEIPPGHDRAEPALTLSYAATVMPAMADKIEQLRELYDQAVTDVRTARRELVRLANATGDAATLAQSAYLALNAYRPNRVSDQVSG